MLRELLAISSFRRRALSLEFNPVMRKAVESNQRPLDLAPDRLYMITPPIVLARVRVRGSVPASQSSVDCGANVGPDCLDLLQLERAAPGRHLGLSVEHDVQETVMILGPQAPKVERGAATGVP